MQTSSLTLIKKLFFLNIIKYLKENWIKFFYEINYDTFILLYLFIWSIISECEREIYTQYTIKRNRKLEKKLLANLVIYPKII